MPETCLRAECVADAGAVCAEVPRLQARGDSAGLLRAPLRPLFSLAAHRRRTQCASACVCAAARALLSQRRWRLHRTWLAAAFMQAAWVATRVVELTACQELSSTPQMLTECWEVIADATTLMAVPRDPPELAISLEAGFVEQMRIIESTPAYWVPLDAARRRALEAWRKLERSGVLHASARHGQPGQHEQSHTRCASSEC
jgi:hypothetical protein